MISIVMPFYKKNIEFDFVFHHFNLALFNEQKNLELLIIIDDPNGHESILQIFQTLIKQKQIRFSVKVVLNEKEHAWRPPCKAINVGIRHASHSKILVVSPETIFTPDGLQKLIQNCTANTYSIGLIKFINLPRPIYQPIDEIILTYPSRNFTPYGSIMFTKAQAESIGGYDEGFKKWGGDDDDFRNRLKGMGYQQKITLAQFIHVNLFRHAINGCPKKKEELEYRSMLEKIFEIKGKHSLVANDGRYGNDFSHIILEHSFEQDLISN